MAPTVFRDGIAHSGCYFAAGSPGLAQVIWNHGATISTWMRTANEVEPIFDLLYAHVGAQTKNTYRYSRARNGLRTRSNQCPWVMLDFEIYSLKNRASC